MIIPELHIVNQSKAGTKLSAVRNACKVCSPLGASVAFKGIANCVPLIHGSQGCSTYIRRYLISHYKEPVDIASSNFTQDATIFGGGENFKKAIDNIIAQYQPDVIGVATSCLSETIGEDVDMHIKQWQRQYSSDKLVKIIHASTPSYAGTHVDGFHEAIAATVKALAVGGSCNESINLFSGFLSPADLRHLKEILEDFGIDYTLLPDYSETLDNPWWAEYQKIPQGGTPVNKIARMGAAAASIELGTVFNTGNAEDRTKEYNANPTAAEWLEKALGITRFTTPLPIGIANTDKFFSKLKIVSPNNTPKMYQDERGRLVDSYVDAHKYVFEKRAVLYGEEDFVLAMASFLREIGIVPVLCASGAGSSLFKSEINKICDSRTTIIAETDFETIAQYSRELKPDIIIGNSKGYYIARELGIPIVRCGFPIHDRIGGQRVLHVGYRGTQMLFDTIVNSLLQYKQDKSAVGYKYM